MVTLPFSLLRYAGALALLASGVFAQEASAPRRPADPSILSPRVKAAVNQRLPAYAPPSPPAPETRPAVFISRLVPVSDEVVRLPDFRVQVRALPPRSQPKDGELLRDYLGSSHGLDRGVFNRFILRWETNVATFAIDGAQSNESRARTAYYDDMRLQHRAQLTDLAELVKLSGDAESATWIKRESDRAFMRRAPFVRRQ